MISLRPNLCDMSRSDILNLCEQVKLLNLAQLKAKCEELGLSGVDGFDDDDLISHLLYYAATARKQKDNLLNNLAAMNVGLGLVPQRGVFAKADIEVGAVLFPMCNEGSHPCIIELTDGDISSLPPYTQEVIKEYGRFLRRDVERGVISFPNHGWEELVEMWKMELNSSQLKQSGNTGGEELEPNVGLLDAPDGQNVRYIATKKINIGEELLLCDFSHCPSLYKNKEDIEKESPWYDDFYHHGRCSY